MEERIGIIGGSGLGQALLAQAGGKGKTLAVRTPFGMPAAEPILLEYEGSGGEKVPVVFLARHGVGHVFSPTQVPYRANIYALKSLGCKWILASGAVGSLREHIGPGELVLVDQAIDKTTRRVQSFFDGTGGEGERGDHRRDADVTDASATGSNGGGAVHVELAEPFCPQLRQILWEVAGGMGKDVTESVKFGEIRVHGKGTYVCMEGPGFSTRAESLMHRAWGGDVIGMTAMPEAKLAREAEISYAMIALSTDYDCWRPHGGGGGDKGALLAEIIGNLKKATENALALIKAAVPAVWARRGEEFAAHRALELAIWSDKGRISAEARKRLELLWGKYFPPPMRSE